jgi:hypothetical protein
MQVKGKVIEHSPPLLPSKHKRIYTSKLDSPQTNIGSKIVFTLQLNVNGINF